MRIVSLLPSATETVYALSSGGALVGRSEECDYPSEALKHPIVMRARAHDDALPSGEIDSRVRAALRRDESLYELDLSLLSALRPDVILTQDLCAVCSVTEDEVRQACLKAGIDPRILSLAPTRLSEVWAAIEAIGSEIGRNDEARALVASVQDRVSSVARPPGSTPRINVVEWLDPPMLAGLWAADMVDTAGGTYLGPAPGGAARRSSWEEIAGEKADLVLLAPCNFSVDRTERELRRDRTCAALAGLAPRRGCWAIDEAYFSRPGPRLCDGIELVADLMAGRDPRGKMPCRRLLLSSTVEA